MKRFFRIQCTALAMFSALIVNAQSLGEIRGKVYDEQGQTIPGASIGLVGGSAIYQTGSQENGNYSIKAVLPGYYTVKIYSVGKKPCELHNFQVLSEGISFVKDIVLQDSTIMGGPVVVEIIRDPLIDKNGGNIFTIRSKELKQLSVSHGGVIKNIVSALMSDAVSSNRGEELHVRGSRNGTTLYIIDGIKIQGNVPNIPSSGISSIQVYSGGIPARFGDCTGGVVVVETKNYLEDFYTKQALYND